MAPAPLGRPMFYRNVRSARMQMMQTGCFISTIVLISLVMLRFDSEPASASLKMELYSKSNYTLKHNGWASRGSKGLKVPAVETERKILSIKGSTSNYIKVNLQPILRKDKYTDIVLELVEIDPTKFSAWLKHFVHLRKLSLVNVKLGEDIGQWNYNFTRVLLPFLEEFTIDMTIGFRDQYREYLPDLTETNLMKLLFYDKSSQVAYQEITKEFSEKLVVDGVAVVIRVDGWYVLSLRQVEDKSFDVMVAVLFTDKFLEIVNTYLDVSSLTMTECSVSKPQIPQNLTYLNFYRVTLIDSDIEEVLGSMSNLTQLFLELKNATLDISGIPESVTELAISDITRAKYKRDSKCFAKKVGVGFPMDSEVIENLGNIFVQLEKIGIFEPVDGMQHAALHSVRQSSATWGYFEGFNRKGVEFINNRTETEAEMEDFLDKLGVDPADRKFLLVRSSPSDVWSMEVVTNEHQLRYRYQFLGWDRFISESMYKSYFT